MPARPCASHRSQQASERPYGPDLLEAPGNASAQGIIQLVQVPTGLEVAFAAYRRFDRKKPKRKPITARPTKTATDPFDWVNGVAVFNWGDGQSWANEQTWFNLAPAAEVYDLDVCPGHSAFGTYHHHSHPVCLADQLGDGGSAHSPVYGYAADGVPIAGPWVTDGVLARSSWRLRDYDDPGSSTGCGAVGMRSCLMVDQLDPSTGTVATDHPGPDTSDTVRTMSGNELTAVDGYYLEDWYFDAALDDGSPEAVDEHNGHLGGLPGFAQPRYHYHVTRSVEPGMPGGLADVFPFYVGPTFWGELHDNALLLGDPGGPGQGGPGGPPDLTEAAQALGVTVAELQAALGPPPPNMAGAAATLGVDVEVLRGLIGRP